MPCHSKYIFIINPIAGTRHKKAISEAITSALPEDDCEIIFTEYQGHAHQIALQKVAEGHIHIVAVGGDGTVNEVASALVNTSCHLGIIPAGSGNGLARHLKIPMQLQASIELIRQHEVRPIDVGWVNGRYFFCTCGTGFDASVGREFATNSRRGMISYVRAVIHQYIRYLPKKYILKTGKRKIKLEAFLVTFANSGQYGGDAYIAPNARIDDGVLDLCILRPFPKVSTLDLGLRLFFKNIDQSPYLEVMQITKASLKRKGKRSLHVHIDGEPSTIRGKLKIRVIAGGLQVMVPAKKPSRKPRFNIGAPAVLKKPKAKNS
jgi:YegS/Rv2252/BmrU family lipid kinase